MNAINELRRMRIGFKAIDYANANQGYMVNEAKRTTFDFALVESDGDPVWKFIKTNARGSFNDQDLFGFCSGAAYEAEIGLRTVNGKKMNAETYIGSWRQVQVTDVTKMTDSRLIVEMDVQVNDKEKLLADDFYGYTFDWATCSLVDHGDHLTATIPVISFNNYLVATCFWSANPKRVTLQAMDHTEPAMMGEGVDFHAEVTH
jgi:hypothetical protein